MIQYFTISKCGNIYMLDSISKDYSALKKKFPNEVIYKWDKPFKSIYLNQYQLIKANG